MSAPWLRACRDADTPMTGQSQADLESGLPRDARRRKTRTGATVFAELICSFFLDREKQV